ncbi:DNLZ [Candida jiufengensis]|uniref:DNLZ n=1 Tax=Candida jiufengensis TaxID=497108 RepID=UPI0022250F6E|nr:DNLZ [Candida jiufengensis]KAI5950158.1 DNLZ [Candida jiufengensis]
MLSRSSLIRTTTKSINVPRNQFKSITKRQFLFTLTKPYIPKHFTPVFKISNDIKRFQSSGSANQPDPNSDKGELLIEFTCNVCDTRSKHNMSKQAYEHGTVLIQCPKCKSRHLIADNLGFIRDEKFNLKDYLESEGQSIDSNVLEFNKVPEPLAHSSGQTANESKPKEEKILDLEAPSGDNVVKDTKKD